MKKLLIFILLFGFVSTAIASPLRENKTITGDAGLDGVPITLSFKGTRYWNDIVIGKIYLLFVTFDVYIILSKGDVVGSMSLNNRSSKVTGIYTTENGRTLISWESFIFKGWLKI